MSRSRARKPFAVEAANAAGRVLGALGLRPVRLDVDSLLEAASRRTGLDDFGAAGFREGLATLVESWERDAALSLLGRLIARRDGLALLENRLRMEHEHRRHPEIARGELAAPLFVVGLPRTGTSLLHELLALDPASRAPLTWEVQKVWPPPTRAGFETDPRIAEVDRQLAGVDRLLPDFKRMHPMGARLPQECAVLTGHDFASMVFHTSYRVPGYQAWLERLDWRPVYASHRRQLQYLQWRCPAERWVLKSPQHLWTLDALFEVYPDACVVQTHRDPLRVLASLVSLIATLRSMASERVDPFEIGADWSKRLAEGLQTAMDVRERRGESGAVLDLHYAELVADPLASVARIYSHFGMELSAEAESRMRAFLADNPKHKHGAHRYGLADAGLDAEVEGRRFAGYRERYGVEPEPLP